MESAMSLDDRLSARDSEAVGLALGTLRRGQALRQEDLALRLRNRWGCRVDAREVSRFEAGTSKMILNGHRLIHWAEALGTSAEHALQLGRYLLKLIHGSEDHAQATLPEEEPLLCALCEGPSPHPAACFGTYDGEAMAPACDNCCDHIQQGGWCLPTSDPSAILRKISPSSPE